MIQKLLKLIPGKILLEVGGSILLEKIELTKWTYLKIRWGGGGLFDKSGGAGFGFNPKKMYQQSLLHKALPNEIIDIRKVPKWGKP